MGEKNTGHLFVTKTKQDCEVAVEFPLLNGMMVVSRTSIAQQKMSLVGKRFAVHFVGKMCSSIPDTRRTTKGHQMSAQKGGVV